MDLKKNKPCGKLKGLVLRCGGRPLPAGNKPFCKVAGYSASCFRPQLSTGNKPVCKDGRHNRKIAHVGLPENGTSIRYSLPAFNRIGYFRIVKVF